MKTVPLSLPRLAPLLLLFLLLLRLCAPHAAAAEGPARCGEYSFELPPGFDLRSFEDNSPAFNKTLIINQPQGPKDFSQAIIFCRRELKTEYRAFALPAKERLHLQLAPRRNTQMFITATEDVLQEELRSKFSLLEERSQNSRHIRDRENFFVAIELDGQNEAFHTMLFVCDFRNGDGFFDFEEYKAHVTSVATRILDSLQKTP